MSQVLTASVAAALAAASIAAHAGQSREGKPLVESRVVAPKRDR